MRYEIDYLCDSAGVEKLVNAVQELLPKADTTYIDLTNNSAMPDADIHLVVFSFLKGSVPYEVVHTLNAMSGKRILLLVTVMAEGSEAYCLAARNRITAFLPENCDFRGIHLCRCNLPDNILMAAQKQLELDPYNERAKRACESYVRFRDCPDENDISKVCEFVCSRLMKNENIGIVK